MTTTPFDKGSAPTQLLIYARFHAQGNKAAAMAEAIRGVAAPTRAEPGCLEYSAGCSIRDDRQFYIYSRWVDEAAFLAHAELPHTVRFIESMERLVDQPVDVSRARGIA
jgi:quinol monooxygenase YgiN